MFADFTLRYERRLTVGDQEDSKFLNDCADGLKPRDLAGNCRKYRRKVALQVGGRLQESFRHLMCTYGKKRKDEGRDLQSPKFSQAVLGVRIEC